MRKRGKKEKETRSTYMYELKLDERVKVLKKRENRMGNVPKG